MPGKPASMPREELFYLGKSFPIFAPIYIAGTATFQFIPLSRDVNTLQLAPAFYIYFRG
jgi:hypothetical protein